MTEPLPILLSKSKFVAGVQCLKRLYLQVRHPGLAEQPDDGLIARLEQGQEVGLLAQGRFPGGVLVSLKDGVDVALADTGRLLKEGSAQAIFEATFQYDDVLARVDVLQRRPGNRWRLIEVKSSVDFKPHYAYDIGIQHRVLTGCGITLASSYLMHLNRDYIYDGQGYCPQQLFKLRNVTREVQKLNAEIPKLLASQRDALMQADPPDIAPGPQCYEPIRCEFFRHCNPTLLPNDVSFLPRLSKAKGRKLRDLGITRIHDIPDDFPLTQIQSRVRTTIKTGQVWVSKTLSKELARLKYPLYFMDFESLAPAIPRFVEMWPYAQIPFQWSVHRQSEPDLEPDHFEFLSDDADDPRRRFVDSLCAVVLETPGPIVVYNAGFESQRLGQLAQWLPEYAARIEKIRARLWDLLRFLQRNFYHPRFNGSFSLKAVLPALVPDLTYNHMEVSDGSQAGLAWERMVRSDADPTERSRLKTALSNYCSQDTLAMVKILEWLRLRV